MQRKRDGLVPIGEALSELDGPVPPIRKASPQALHHFTQTDQVNLLVSASEAAPDLGFMARTMALCSLPRSNPRDRLRYVRRNGPYTLVMNAGGGIHQSGAHRNDLNLALSMAHQLKGCRSRKSGASALDLRSCLSWCNAAIRLKATRSGL